jgi:hypothetical protein
MDGEEHHSLPLLVQVSLKRKYVDKVDPREVRLTHTANNFGLIYSRKRISQNSFPNSIHIIPKSSMEFCHELSNPKRNYENQI